MEPEIRFSYNIEKFRGRRLLAKSPKKPEYVPPEKVDPAATDLKLLGTASYNINTTVDCSLNNIHQKHFGVKILKRALRNDYCSDCYNMCCVVWLG